MNRKMKWYLKRFDDLLPQEVYDILQLRNEVFIVEQTCPYLDIDGKDMHSYHLFAKDEKNVICAYLRILDKGQTFDDLSIGRVIVRKEERGNGLAKQMLIKAIQFIETTLGIHQIRISAQAYLKDFYSEIGFTACSEVYLEDNIPHIEMIYKSKTVV
jgi:ElaA protein